MDSNLNVCHFCDKAFSTPSKLMYHERIHTNTRPYSCDICRKRFCSQSNLNKHKVTHMPKRFRCEVCKVLFSSKYHAQRHIDNLHKEVANHAYTIGIVESDTELRIFDYGMDSYSDSQYARTCDCPICWMHCLCAVVESKCGICGCCASAM